MKDLDALNIGGSIIIDGRGGWKIKIIKTADGFDLIHFNPISDDPNQVKFFRYSTVGNAYGAGKIEQEPTLGVACRTCGVDTEGLIVGALIIGDEGKIAERFSWTNLVINQKKNFRITLHGELFIDGTNKGFLQAIFLPDKNRMSGFVGIFGTNPVEKVKILEMEDILLKCL